MRPVNQFVPFGVGGLWSGWGWAVPWLCEARSEPNGRAALSDEEEEAMLVDWFTLIHDKHMLVRREAELVYTWERRLARKTTNAAAFP